MRTLFTWLVVVGVIAASASPALASTASDLRAAKAAVLQPSDVPSEFTGGPVDQAEVPETPSECGKAIAKADKSVLGSPHARSAYALPSNAGFAQIQNTVAVLPRIGKARKAMAAYANADDAQSCFEALFVEFFASPNTSVTATLGEFAPELDDKGNARVVKGGDQFLGYGGAVSRTAGGAPQNFEVAVALARDGRAVTQLVVMTLGSIPQDDAQAMLQAVVDRMSEI